MYTNCLAMLMSLIRHPAEMSLITLKGQNEDTWKNPEYCQIT